MNHESFKICGDRLLRRIEELGAVGATARGGVSRIAGTDEDRAGRDLLVEWMKAEQLDVKIDYVGNIYGIRAGRDNSLAPIMVGSHIDTVVNGGKLDGTLGVLAGLELVTRLGEVGLQTVRPIVISAFTNEEGVRFQPDMMGSLVAAQGLTVEEALATEDRAGISLGDELKRIGYGGTIEPGSLKPRAYVELHIEQGPILQAENVSIGVVESVQGILWLDVKISGQANHAGTTPMHLRKDAGYCAARISSFVHDLGVHDDQQVATVGVIELSPNVVNVVPGFAHMTIDLRNPNKVLLENAENAVREFVDRLREEQGVEVKITTLVRFDPVIFDEAILKIIEKVTAEKGLSYRRMTSGAGHDAQMIARQCPSAMIFVPSIGGISHNPDEWTEPCDVIAGANVLALTVIKLAMS